MGRLPNVNTELQLRLAIPSDGEMFEPTQRFLESCGLPVMRPNRRRYTASMPALEGVEVVFQRTADIPSRVEEGNADLGIVGLDRFHENRLEESDSFIMISNLGFGRCNLVIAVPEAWVDVTEMIDLANLSIEFRESGRNLRIATKYPRLVSRFLFKHGVNYFSLIPVSGTLEVAPSMGYADLIADITSSGITLKANQLKPVEDGEVLSSEAGLIGNRRRLRIDPKILSRSQEITRRIESYLKA
jgi:ATP phosphoribosyltransferase